MSTAPQVRFIQVEPLPTAFVRRRAALQDLARVVPAGCGEAWRFVRTAPHLHADRNVALYLDGAITLECGVIVDQPFTSTGEVLCTATPGGPVAAAIHMGRYDRLGDTHRAITQWCSAQRLSLAGPNWEIYGHWNDDPAQLRTDVFYLLVDPDPPAAKP